MPIWMQARETMLPLALATLLSGALTGEIREYCQFDALEATCPENHVVIVEHAFYGRMRAGGCVRKAYGEMGCQANVIPYVDSVCSGRRQCTLGIHEIAQLGIRPCQEDLTSHLEASYTCLPVIPGPTQGSCNYGSTYDLPLPNGYLASSSVQHSGASHRPCTLRIRAPPGQRVNLTLFDFSAWDYRQNNEIGRTVCRRYAIINEGNGVRETPICGGQIRHRNIYMSEGNSVDIRLINSVSPEEQAHFVIKYNTFGCPQFRPPRDARVIRVDGVWMVRCNHTEQSWSIQCDGKSWIGHVGNCSKVSDDAFWNALNGDWSSPYGILMVVALGIILGVIVGISLLLIALLWFKRSHHFKRETPNVQTKTLADAECEDPFIQTCQQPSYNGEPDYASWINQRPLPIQPRDPGFGKPSGQRDIQHVDPCLRTQHSCIGPNSQPRACHIYESPQFDRRISVQ